MSLFNSFDSIQGSSFSVKSVSGTQQLVRDGLWEKVCRFIFPCYSRAADYQVGQFLNHQFKQINVTEQAETLVKITKYFLENAVRAYWIKGSLNSVEKVLQDHLFAIKIAKDFSLPFNLVIENPGFLRFVKTNHLHHRIDLDYKRAGLAFYVNENKQICLREYDPKAPQKEIWKPWSEFPVDEKGKMQGYELLAHGWQKFDGHGWTKLEPIKIVDIEQTLLPEVFVNKLDSKNQNCAIELVTAAPRYSLSNLGFGLGFFGHTYLKLYKPIFEHGKFTGKVAIYSVGYNLKHITVPDIFEFVERPRTSSLVGLKQNDFNRLLQIIEIMQEQYLAEKASLERKGAERQVAFPQMTAKEQSIYNQFRNGTCANFAAAIFNLVAPEGMKIDGRSLVASWILPKWLHSTIDTALSYLPKCVVNLASKVQLLTRGFWPSVMQQQQIDNLNQGFDANSHNMDDPQSLLTQSVIMKS